LYTGQGQKNKFKDNKKKKKRKIVVKKMKKLAKFCLKKKRLVKSGVFGMNTVSP
jgi:hypothetical protein